MSEVTKTIYFLRHGQSLFNAAERDPMIPDAGLTHKGLAQARGVQPQVAQIQNLEAIIVSPLSRAIHTMLIAFQDHIDTVPVIVDPLCREVTCGMDDLGSTPDELARAFPQLSTQFATMPSVWWYTGAAEGQDGNDPQLSYERYRKDEFEEPASSYRPRLQSFKNSLLSCRQKVIAVVCHNRVIDKLTGVCARNCELVRTEVVGRVLLPIRTAEVTVLRRELTLCNRAVVLERVEDEDQEVDIIIIDKETGQLCKADDSIHTQKVLDRCVRKYHKLFSTHGVVKWHRSSKTFSFHEASSSSSSDDSHMCGC